jgi:hypothetical protein
VPFTPLERTICKYGLTTNFIKSNSTNVVLESDKWKCPLSEWVKLNVNAAFFDESNRGETGPVIVIIKGGF